MLNAYSGEAISEVTNGDSSRHVVLKPIVVHSRTVGSLGFVLRCVAGYTSKYTKAWNDDCVEGAESAITGKQRCVALGNHANARWS